MRKYPLSLLVSLLLVACGGGGGPAPLAVEHDHPFPEAALDVEVYASHDDRLLTFVDGESGELLDTLPFEPEGDGVTLMAVLAGNYDRQEEVYQGVSRLGILYRHLGEIFFRDFTDPELPVHPVAAVGEGGPPCELYVIGDTDTPANLRRLVFSTPGADGDCFAADDNLFQVADLVPESETPAPAEPLAIRHPGPLPIHDGLGHLQSILALTDLGLRRYTTGFADAGLVMPATEVVPVVSQPGRLVLLVDGELHAFDAQGKATALGFSPAVGTGPEPFSDQLVRGDHLYLAERVGSGFPDIAGYELWKIDLTGMEPPERLRSERAGGLELFHMAITEDRLALNTIQWFTGRNRVIALDPAAPASVVELVESLVPLTFFLSARGDRLFLNRYNGLEAPEALVVTEAGEVIERHPASLWSGLVAEEILEGGVDVLPNFVPAALALVSGDVSFDLRTFSLRMGESQLMIADPLTGELTSMLAPEPEDEWISLFGMGRSVLGVIQTSGGNDDMALIDLEKGEAMRLTRTPLSHEFPLP
ncbi:MAG TPA: hypothetical protein ENK54_10280 [Thiotrichales bacterium]|nr:hypothetical protein [Thiotrichales bacterium]